MSVGPAGPEARLLRQAIGIEQVDPSAWVWPLARLAVVATSAEPPVDHPAATAVASAAWAVPGRQAPAAGQRVDWAFPGRVTEALPGSVVRGGLATALASVSADSVGLDAESE